MATSGTSACAPDKENYKFTCQFFEPAFVRQVLDLSRHGTEEEMDKLLDETLATIVWANHRLKRLKDGRKRLELASLALRYPLKNIWPEIDSPEEHDDNCFFGTKSARSSHESIEEKAAQGRCTRATVGGRANSRSIDYNDDDLDTAMERALCFDPCQNGLLCGKEHRGDELDRGMNMAV